VLKMLSGLLHPTAGKARVLGYVPWERHDAMKRQFALLMGQKNALWWDLPARESLELNRAIYGIDRAKFKQIVDGLSELLDVGHKLNVMVRELSLGERMKMELIAALLHSPRVLFLDEPTIGLDVISQKAVREFLASYNADHKIVTLLTSHYMTDIEELCDRVIIIDHGSLFFDGRLAAVIDRFADHKLVTLHSESAAQCPRAHLERYGEIVALDADTVRLKIKRDRVIAACKALLDEIPVKDIDIEEVPVEDIIRQLFGTRGN